MSGKHIGYSFKKSTGSSITFIFSFSAASNSAIFAIESTRTLEPNTCKN